jgi:predicted acetyltransferase
MAIEIRSCRDDAEMREYYMIGAYVFADTELIPEETAPTLPDWTTCAFVEGKLASIMAAYPFTVRLNGAPVKVAGVTQVGTLPGYRRQGLLRKTMGRAFEEMRERDQPIAILWASMGAIYQRFGYGLASESIDYHMDPRIAAFQEGGEAPGSVTVETPEGGYPTAKMLYIEYASPRNLHIHRSRPLWEVGVLRGDKKHGPVRVAIYSNADGQARGHIVYQVHHEDFNSPGPNQVMSVRDFVYLDLEAYRGLWEYIRKHDLVRRVDMNGMAPDDPAPDLLLEPRSLAKMVQDGIWLRVVDAEKSFPSRPYGERGELTIEIAGDTMCPWNSGRWLMETDGTTTEVRRTDREPDITVTPNGLASLLSGCRTATHLARVGRITGRDPQALQKADRLFRTEFAPHCPNGF